MNVLFYHFVFQKGNAFSKSITKTMVQVVKSVQRKHWKHEGEVKSVVLLSFLFTLNTFSSADFDANFNFLEGLKLASTILKIYGKCFLFHAKCSYRYQDNQIFVISLFFVQRFKILRENCKRNNYDNYNDNNFLNNSKTCLN